MKGNPKGTNKGLDCDVIVAEVGLHCNLPYSSNSWLEDIAVFKFIKWHFDT